MIILLAVLALVVVKALAESPWGIFTVGATIPIAHVHGRLSAILARRQGDGSVGHRRRAAAAGGLGRANLFIKAPHWSKVARADSEINLAWAIIVYGLAASVLPVWLLLAPRDYLSTFMKLGTIFALALGIFFVLPDLQMPARDASSSMARARSWRAKYFPFCFITIACGAISGFHTLIASGTTPKIITRESYARPIGYGAMCLESLVAIMALIAACTLDPGVYFSMNIKGEAGGDRGESESSLGFPGHGRAHG